MRPARVLLALPVAFLMAQLAPQTVKPAGSSASQATAVQGVTGGVPVPVSGSFALAGSATPADAASNPTTALLNQSFPMLYNGATWDRWYGAITTGARVNVTNATIACTQSGTWSDTVTGSVANDTSAIGNGVETQPAVARASPTATTAGRSEKLQTSATNGGVFANITGGAGVLVADVQPTNTAAFGNGLEMLPAIAQASTAPATNGRAVPLAVNTTTGHQIVDISDGTSNRPALVTTANGAASGNGLFVMPGVARSALNGESAGNVNPISFDSISGGAFTNATVTTNAIGPATSASWAVNTTTSIKASAGNLYGLSCYNQNASVCWVQLYNASAPTCGTSVVASFAVPPSGTLNIGFNDLPIFSFSTAIGTCADTTATGLTACASAIACSATYK